MGTSYHHIGLPALFQGLFGFTYIKGKEVGEGIRIINEDEAKLLARHHNLINAVEKILGMGVEVVVIKKGESGSITCDNNGNRFILPAYPTSGMVDPTGAGDSFAGAFLGYLAQTGKTDFSTMKTAVAYGTVVASFAIAGFSLEGLRSIKKEQIDQRLKELQNLTSF